MTETYYPAHSSLPVERLALQALRLVEYGSCDGCGNKGYCVVCGARFYVYDAATGESAPELHESDCEVGKALGRCRP